MRRYRPVTAYRQLKLSNLMFPFELNRRLRHALHAMSVAAHPGIADTNLFRADNFVGGPIHRLASVVLIDTLFKNHQTGHT
ncbi:hypothetical protein BZM26_38035 [Paraburkholderia strydomiana]|nr:hypothetical protein BZM26_38035 [Paraburkholderia strydomiana]